MELAWNKKGLKTSLKKPVDAVENKNVGTKPSGKRLKMIELICTFFLQAQSTDGVRALKCIQSLKRTFPITKHASK